MGHYCITVLWIYIHCFYLWNICVKTLLYNIYSCVQQIKASLCLKHQQGLSFVLSLFTLCVRLSFQQRCVKHTTIQSLCPSHIIHKEDTAQILCTSVGFISIICLCSHSSECVNPSHANAHEWIFKRIDKQLKHWMYLLQSNNVRQSPLMSVFTQM